MTHSQNGFNSLQLAIDYIDRHFGSRYIFPISAGKKFPPCVKDNLDGNASNDPEQIKAWVKDFGQVNWGVALRKSHLFVVDVDTNAAKGKVGQQTFDLLDLEYGFPDTEIVTTPSGGHHHYYVGDHVMALGKYGLGIDVDSPNYVLIEGCVFKDGTSYTGNGKDAVNVPAWIYDVIKHAKVRLENAGEAVVELDKPENVTAAVQFLTEDAEPAIAGQGGDFETLKVGLYLRDLGISESNALLLMMEYYNDRCDPPWDSEDMEKKVANAYTYASLSKIGGKTAEADFTDDDAQEIADTIAVHATDPSRINSKENRERLKAEKEEQRKIDAEAGRQEALAIQAERDKDTERVKERIYSKRELIEGWVYINPLKLFVCRDPGDPNAGNDARKMWGLDTFNNAFQYAAKGTRISSELLGKKTGTIDRLDAMIYRPGCKEFVGRSYNLYQPSPIVPSLGETDEEKATAAAALKIWNDHLVYLFPDPVERGHLLNWIGWLLQNLALKPKHMLLVQGNQQGTGKSFIADMLALILGRPNVSRISQSELSSTFNRWAMNAKLLLVEELRAVDKKEIANKLHPMITQEQIPINDKGEKTFDIDNCFGIFAMTNDDAAIGLDNSDRRYLVIRTDAKPKDAAYYVRLYRLLNQPAAVAAIAHSLMHRDLESYSGLGRAPITAAKADMMAAGASPIERFMLESSGMAPLTFPLVTINDVVEDLLPHRLRSSAAADITVAKVLKDKFNAIKVGQVRIGKGNRPVLWALQDRVKNSLLNTYKSGGAKQKNTAGAQLAAIYEKARATSAEDGAISDFDLDDPAA